MILHFPSLVIFTNKNHSRPQPRFTNCQNFFLPFPFHCPKLKAKPRNHEANYTYPVYCHNF